MNGKNKYLYFLKRWAGSLILLPFMIYFALSRGEFHFIDYLNLLIHEGGHGVFKVFGEFIYTLGGTLMQIIIPSLCIFYFLKRNQLIGTQISLLWLGENLINISVYAADARARVLPLLGGEKVYHDWTRILRLLDSLEYDTEVGYFFFGSALLAFLIALLLPVLMREYEYKNFESLEAFSETQRT